MAGIAVVGMILLILTGNLLYLSGKAGSLDAFAVVAWLVWVGWLAAVALMIARKVLWIQRELHAARALR